MLDFMSYSFPLQSTLPVEAIQVRHEIWHIVEQTCPSPVFFRPGLRCAHSCRTALFARVCEWLSDVCQHAEGCQPPA